MSASLVETTASSSTTAQRLNNSGNSYNTQSMDDSKKPNSTAATEKDENERNSNDPLPAELRKILSEVARTGVSQSLPWSQSSRHHETASSTSALHPEGTQPMAAMRQPSGNSQNYFDKRRSSGSSPFSNTPNFQQQAASRKPHRNGLHLKRRRISAESGGNANSSRVYLIRTSSGSNSIFSQASAGTGRNSGSEVEDSTQYECDSEGTSATSASERSVDRREQRRKLASIQSARLRPEQQPPVSYNALKDVVRNALDLVLDHWYRRFGYKLTTAEKRMKLNSASQNFNADNGQFSMQETENESSSAEVVFQHRRQRLHALLQGPLESHNVGDGTNGATIKAPQPVDDGPPFTIQRIAEVLVAPEKYYTKTHKLCNCLEKLLLVTSSSNAFGGSSGGDLGHGAHEELDAAAWADEQETGSTGGQSKRTLLALSSEESVAGGAGLKEDAMSDTVQDENKKTSEECSDSPGPCVLTVKETNEEVVREEAARVALRSKFDHDPHVQNINARAVAKGRGMTSSPPPPGLLNAAAESAQTSALLGHGNSGGGGGGRPKKQQSRPERASPPSNATAVARSPSPILFTHGVGADGTGSSFAMSSSSSPQHANNQFPHSHSNLLAFGSQVLDAGSSAGANNNEFNLNTGNASAYGGDLEGDPGRSSASNSDVDSESDDISLDDSASDRSDGSDSGSAAATSLHLPASLHEPFTAARVMALSRMHQQQQLQRGWLLQQSRGLMTASQNANSGVLMSNSDAVRHQAEVGYQSGDSIDSMIAEDSGGSDSSSSDFAD